MRIQIVPGYSLQREKIASFFKRSHRRLRSVIPVRCDRALGRVWGYLYV
ncbi:hypothetical protein H6F52_13475 [Coleofasciculus sp. FACHB-542]|nr:hypothetical protein [Coleofasciculus sp. FACHB-542]